MCATKQHVTKLEGEIEWEGIQREERGREGRMSKRHKIYHVKWLLLLQCERCLADRYG